MTKAEIQQVKLRFGIIGNNEALMRAIDIAIQVAPTDLSVLITGESGVGKESFPQIIHQYSRRKHGQYIAVNCGAIARQGSRLISVTGFRPRKRQNDSRDGLSVNGRGISVKPTAEQSSLMKSANYLCLPRHACCVCLRAVNSSR